MTQEPTSVDSSWAHRLGEALDELTESVTGVHGRLPELSNEHYRWLAREAENSADASIAFDAYFPKLNSDPHKAVDLLKTHPVIRRVLRASQGDDAVMMLMPRRAFRVELEMLIRYLTKPCIRKDSRYAASNLARYLVLSDENRLPGHEITLLAGVEVDRRLDICDGAFIAPYEEVVQLGLLRETERGPWEEEIPDFRSMGATALVRDFVWGPGIGTAMTSRTPRHAMDVDVNYSCLPKHESPGIAIDLLSVVARCRIQVLGSELRGAAFLEDVSQGFGPSPLSWFALSGRIDYQRSSTRLLDKDVASVTDVLSSWVEPDEKDERALRRLASAVARTGRFGQQDSILDLSIALEIMYELDRELTYKLGTRAGYFLGSSADDRVRIFEEIRRFYDIRSRIIHGNNPGTEATTKAAEEGFQIARDTFFKLRATDVDKWDSLVMRGAGSSPPPHALPTVT